MSRVKFLSSLFRLSTVFLIGIVTVSKTAWSDEIDQDLGLRSAGGEVHADAFSGMLTTSIPIVVPAGRNGLQPTAARLYVQGKQHFVALKFLQLMLQQTNDKSMRNVLERRVKEVIIERDLDAIDHALESFQERFARHPKILKELLDAHLLGAIPEEPFGGEYRLDEPTTVVSSTTHPNRLRLYDQGSQIATARMQ